MPPERAAPKSLIPVRINLTLAAVLAGAGVFQAWILPALLLPLSLHWAWTLVPAVLLSNTLWALVHEAFHGAFHPDPHVNRGAGRALAILHGGVFHQLRFAHLTHHRHNRSVIDRTEIYDPEQTSKRVFAAGYYATILGGLYLMEVASALALLLPSPAIGRLIRLRLSGDDAVSRAVRHRALAVLLPQSLTAMRTDAVLLLAFHGTSFWLYGQHAGLLLAALLGRGLLISLNDNVYHYNTPLTDSEYGKNLRLGTVGSGLLLHFNFHHVHHRQPYLSWKALPHGGDRPVEFAGSYWNAIVRQLRGPVPGLVR